MSHQEDREENQDLTAEENLQKPTWEDDIKGFFTQTDIGCMRSAGSKFDLARYEDVVRKAPDILPLVARGSMPLRGRRWSTGKVQRFKEWMDDGCPRGPRGAEGVALREPTQEEAK